MNIFMRPDAAVIAELDAAPLSFRTVMAHESIEVLASMPERISLLNDAIMIAVRVSPKSNTASARIDLSLSG